MLRTAIAVALLFALTCCTAGILHAQTFDTEFYPSGGWTEGDHENELFAPESDEGVFSSPAWGAADPFRDFSKFRFGTVRYRERGLDSRHFAVRLAGVDLTDNLNSYPDWSLVTLVRRSGLGAMQIPQMVATYTPGGIGRSEDYSLRGSGDDLYILLRTGDRYSRGGGDIRHGHTTQSGWSLHMAATGQAGDDGHFTGVYSDEAGGTLSLGKDWSGGTSLTLFAAGGVSDRGSRTAATAEAFDLTGDRRYNPMWGLQNGRTRNSHTTLTRYLFTAAEFRTPLGPGRTLSLTAAMRRNRGGRNRLAWYDAHSPLPDYYRSMPSFFPDWDAAEIIEDAWREGDPTVTQVDWESLYFNNTLSPDGRATYIVEEQVEDARDLHARLSVDRRIDGSLVLSYGIAARHDTSRFYKVAADMLGAEWVPNVDQYVTDTPVYEGGGSEGGNGGSESGDYHTSPPNENDLRNPGRRVHRGERFGYDYSFTRLRPELFGTVRWYGPGHGLTASARLVHTRLQREGFYEKALFPGPVSFGRWATQSFTTYSLSAAGYLNAGPYHRFSLSALASTEAPFARNIFLSPQQHNLAAPGAAPSGLYGAEASWAYTGGGLDLRVGGFVNAVTGETQIRQYYDDLSSTFADMVVRGIDRLGYGVEAGVEARPTRWLTLKAGGSVGRFRYNSEPTATLHEDASGEVISEGIVCYMSGLHTGLPETTAG
ncbi:MAG: hypothetical protein LBU97_04570, partial [Alistipes sp.]|nr:hypothetical protein [Alistipes sp.]